MNAASVVQLESPQSVDIPALMAGLERRMNRPGEPPVLLSVADGAVVFRSWTWQPILLARVEEALDELLGSAWRAVFSWR